MGTLTSRWFWSITLAALAAQSCATQAHINVEQRGDLFGSYRKVVSRDTIEPVVKPSEAFYTRCKGKWSPPEEPLMRARLDFILPINTYRQCDSKICDICFDIETAENTTPSQCVIRRDTKERKPDNWYVFNLDCPAHEMKPGLELKVRTGVLATSRATALDDDAICQAQPGLFTIKIAEEDRGYSAIGGVGSILAAIGFLMWWVP